MTTVKINTTKATRLYSTGQWIGTSCWLARPWLARSNQTSIHALVTAGQRFHRDAYKQLVTGADAPLPDVDYVLKHRPKAKKHKHQLKTTRYGFQLDDGRWAHLVEIDDISILVDEAYTPILEHGNVTHVRQTTGDRNAGIYACDKDDETIAVVMPVQLDEGAIVKAKTMWKGLDLDED